MKINRLILMDFIHGIGFAVEQPMKQTIPAILALFLIHPLLFAAEPAAKKPAVASPAPAASKPNVEESQDARPQDPAASRSIWMPTALPKPYDGIQATGFELGLWHIQGKVNEHLDVGAFVLLPIGVLAVSPTVRWHQSLSDKLHIGAVGQVGFIKSFVDSEEGGTYLLGAGPQLTLGDARKYVNFSAMYYKIGNGFGGVNAILPSVSAGIQVARRVKLNAELTSINGRFEAFDAVDGQSFGEAYALFYGVRIFSESGSLFGDISFIAPIGPDVGEFYSVLPLGFPLINLGFTF